MRRNIYVVSSFTLAIIIAALVSIQLRLPSVIARTGELRPHDALADSSISLAQTDRNAELIRLRKRRDIAQDGCCWVPPDAMARFTKADPTYHRVSGGFHADGTKMYVCRGIVNSTDGTVAPGKFYKDKCYYPWNGKEVVTDRDYELMLIPESYLWQPIDLSWRRELREVWDRPVFGRQPDLEVFTQLSFAIQGGLYRKGWSHSDLYMCRKQLKDGTHLGKYSPRYNFCYIPWGGKELNFSVKDGFDILLLADPTPK